MASTTCCFVCFYRPVFRIVCVHTMDFVSAHKHINKKIKLKPLLFQYSLYRFIAYSIAHSAASIKVPPGPPAPPLATPLDLRAPTVLTSWSWRSDFTKRFSQRAKQSWYLTIPGWMPTFFNTVYRYSNRMKKRNNARRSAQCFWQRLESAHMSAPMTVKAVLRGH